MLLKFFKVIKVILILCYVELKRTRSYYLAIRLFFVYLEFFPTLVLKGWESANELLLRRKVEYDI